MANYEDNWCQEAYDRGFKEGREFEKGKFTKVKELLKGIIDTPMYNQIGGEMYENEEYKELITEAEQFLSEVEK